VDISLLVVN